MGFLDFLNPVKDIVGLVGAVSGLGKKSTSPYDQYLNTINQQALKNQQLGQQFLPDYARQLGLSYNTGGPNQTWVQGTPQIGMPGHGGFQFGQPGHYETTQGPASLSYLPSFDPFTQTAGGQNFMAALAPSIRTMQQGAGVNNYLANATGRGSRGEGMAAAQANMARYIGQARRDYYGNSFLPQQQQFAAQVAGGAFPQAVDPTGRQQFQNQLQVQGAGNLTNILTGLGQQQYLSSLHAAGGHNPAASGGGGTYAPFGGDTYPDAAQGLPGVPVQPGQGVPWSEALPPGVTLGG